MKIIIMVFSCFLLLFSQTAGAVLIDKGTYFADTAAGLDWLKLTETLSRSFNDVKANLGPGGDYEGWQFATSAQFDNLMIGQGADPMTGCYGGVSFCGLPNNNAGVNDRVVELFGDIGELYTRGVQTPGFHGYNFGYIADVYTLGGNARFIALVSSINDEIRTYHDWDDPNVAGNQVRGSFLVRATTVTVPDVQFDKFINWKPLIKDSVAGSPGLEEIVLRVTLKDSNANGVADQAFISFDVWTAGTKNLLFTTRQKGVNLPVLPCTKPVDFDTDISVKFTNETDGMSNAVVLFKMSCVNSSAIKEKEAYKTVVYSADVTRSPAAGGDSWKQAWNGNVVSFDNLDWDNDTVEEIILNLASGQANGTGIRTIILRQSDGTVEADTSYEMIDVQ